jgi:MraZ protein
VLFTGEIDRSIDDKLRVSIPSEMRSGFSTGAGPGIVYATPGLNDAIWLWPEATFESMANTLEQSLLPDEDVMDFEQIHFSQSRRIEIDKSGRIRLPEALLSFAQITDHVFVLGVKDHLELVDATMWEEVREQRRSEHSDKARRAKQQGILGAKRTTE